MSDSPIKENRIVQIATLAPHPRNYRVHPQHQIDQLALSLKRFGQGRSIVVQDAPEHPIIVAGHGIVEAATALKWQELRADILPADWTSEQVEGYLIADNLHSQEASDNEELLALLLQEQQDAGYDLATMGGDDETLRQMLEAMGDDLGGEYSEGAGGDDFDTTPEEGPTRTHLGELWQLGKHRLLVGDSTKREDVERLMQGEKAAICFTSPPFNIGTSPNAPGKSKYLNYEDDLTQDGYCNLLTKFTRLALQYCIYVFVNVQSLSGNKVALIDYLYQFKGHYADTIIWDKTTAEPAMANNVLNSQFEYVHIFSEKANRVIGTKEFRGTLSNVLSMNSRQDKQFSDVHKATFPLSFALHFVTEFSNQGEVALDAFCGSGTTLIACERAGRKCYAMELEPRYADVILARYEAETGQTATLLKRVEVPAHA